MRQPTVRQPMINRTFTSCRLTALIAFWFVATPNGLAGQEDSPPMVAFAAVPLYPPLARAARVEGLVRVTVSTDGNLVVTARAEGNRLLADAAEANARTWTFAKHRPTSFTIAYRYRLDKSCSPNYPIVVLRFPSDIEVTASPVILSDPSAEPRRQIAPR